MITLLLTNPLVYWVVAMAILAPVGRMLYNYLMEDHHDDR